MIAEHGICLQLFQFFNQMGIYKNIGQTRSDIDTLAKETQMEIQTWQEEIQVGQNIHKCNMSHTKIHALVISMVNTKMSTMLNNDQMEMDVPKNEQH